MFPYCFDPLIIINHLLITLLKRKILFFMFLLYLLIFYYRRSLVTAKVFLVLSGAQGTVVTLELGARVGVGIVVCKGPLYQSNTTGTERVGLVFAHPQLVAADGTHLDQSDQLTGELPPLDIYIGLFTVIIKSSNHHPDAWIKEVG